MIYQVKRLYRPNFWAIPYSRMAMRPRPKSLSAMYLASLASNKGLERLKWFCKISESALQNAELQERSQKRKGPLAPKTCHTNHFNTKQTRLYQKCTYDASRRSIVFSHATSFALASVVVMPGFILQKVYGPSNQLAAEHNHCGHQWGFLSELSQFVNLSPELACINFTCFWKKYHIPFHMACALMVLAMRDLPGEVRNQQRRMQHPTRGIVQAFGLRKGLVATFVSDDPETGSEKTLQESVNGPETESNCR